MNYEGGIGASQWNDVGHCEKSAHGENARRRDPATQDGAEQIGTRADTIFCLLDAQHATLHMTRSNLIT